MREAFALQKLLTFFQQKYWHILDINVRNFDETLTKNRAQDYYYVEVISLGGKQCIHTPELFVSLASLELHNVYAFFTDYGMVH